jgi:hypothetical protein
VPGRHKAAASVAATTVRSDSGTPASATRDGGTRPASNIITPGIGPMPVVFPRDPEEWQAMLVDLTFRQICSDSSVCGLALACKDDGFCGACTSDGDCVVGEVCVLDHCLLPANTTCRSRRNCGADELCTLTEYSQGRRGNAALRSLCLGRSGGEEQTAPALTQPEPAMPTPVEVQTLMDSLQEPNR